jgi:hypothetical protein
MRRRSASRPQPSLQPRAADVPRPRTTPAGGEIEWGVAPRTAAPIEAYELQ